MIEFIPATREIDIGGGVVYRPVKSWHSGVLAGERVTEDRGDKSGCMMMVNGLRMTTIPLSVTHRMYWRRFDRTSSSRMISAILSYPNGISAQSGYFWEADLSEHGDVERFDTEEEMEREIRRVLLAAPRAQQNAADGAAAVAMERK